MSILAHAHVTQMIGLGTYAKYARNLILPGVGITVHQIVTATSTSLWSALTCVEYAHMMRASLMRQVL